MATALFVYGTLVDTGLLRRLTGRTFPSRPARLDGWDRVVPVRGYPFILERAGAHVDGLLLADIDPTSLARLDEYEDAGRLYDRVPIEVVTAGGRVPCETYAGDVAALRAAFGPDALRPRA